MDERRAGHAPEIRELIVVEGLHDKHAVERAVRADVWVIGGDRISRTVVQELRRAAAHRGVIVLTDPDGAGERIRRRLNDLVPGCKHAFLPRAAAASPRGFGVEHASPEAIRKALAAARRSQPTAHAPESGTGAARQSAMVAGASGERVGPDLSSPFTLEDLARHGLVNAPAAAQRRQRVGERLGIGYGNAKAFVRKLNVLGVTREEWERAVQAEREQE